MFKVSSRGHYGLRLMTELARAEGQGPLSLTEVARIEGLPLPYLEQLTGPLRRAGLISGTRGLHGGYSLARGAREVTVGQVLRALEGPVSLVDCAADDYATGACAHEATCFSGVLWQRIKASVDAILDGTTLYDLMFDPGFAPGEAPSAAGMFAGAARLELLPVSAGDAQGRPT
ncbi:MAG: Rrf2 family transcriptional regulator [Candidatus Dormibacteria bacterium]